MAERTKPIAPAIAPPGGCERLGCCIPFCRRTFRQDKKLTPWPAGSVIMCGKHWRTAPLELRQRDRHLRRLIKKIERLVPNPKARRMHDRVRRWHDQNWFRAEKIINERAAGIA